MPSLLLLLMLLLFRDPCVTHGQKTNPAAGSSAPAAGDLSLDYNYQDIPDPVNPAPTNAIPAPGAGAKPNNAKGISSSSGSASAGQKGAAQGGMFYPLYGDQMMMPPPGADGVPMGGEDWGRRPPTPWGQPPSPYQPWRPAPESPPLGQLPPPPAASEQGGYYRYGEGMGDQWEALRKQVRQLWRYGQKDQLAQLQKQYPKLNLTQMYIHGGHPGSYGTGYMGYPGGQQGGMGYPGGQQGGMGYPGGEQEGMEGGYWYNGTYYPGYEREGPEMEDGYWYNGTYYPGYEREGPEMEDGYWYNGTYYPGYEREGPEMEDGYWYNGTYYPGYEREGPEMEDGYWYNGTFYPGFEREMPENEGPEEQEELMWWQLHHPRWRDGGANHVAEPNPNPAPAPGPGPGKVPSKWGPYGQPFPPPWKPPPPFQGPIQTPQIPRPPQQIQPQQLQRQLPKPAPEAVAPKPGPSPASSPSQQPASSIPAAPQKAGLTDRGAVPEAPLKLPMTQRQPPRQQRPPQKGSAPPQAPSRRRPPPTRPRRPPPDRVTTGQRNGPPPTLRRRPPPGYRRPPSRPIASNPRVAKMTGGDPSGRRPLRPGVPHTVGGAVASGFAPNRDGAQPQRAGSPVAQPTPPQKRNLGPNSAYKGGGIMAQARSSNSNGNHSGDGFVRKTSSPLDPYRMSSAATWGIVLACLLGVTLVLAPLACLLYKYRQEKRVKKRIFLRRPETGHVEEGIMDAMIMKELGEVNSSRVKRIGQTSSTSSSSREAKKALQEVDGREKRRLRAEVSDVRRPSSSNSLSQARNELRSVPTSTIMVSLDNQSDVLDI